MPNAVPTPRPTSPTPPLTHAATRNPAPPPAAWSTAFARAAGGEAADATAGAGLARTDGASGGSSATVTFTVAGPSAKLTARDHALRSGAEASIVCAPG